MTNDQKTIREKIFYHTTEAEVLKKLKRNPENYRLYLSLDEEWQKRFIEFCTGRKTLPLLYDTIFKKIFNPEEHPERLESLLSCILGQKVRIKRVLPTESILMDGEAMLVMDILVELSNGALVLVEIQKAAYLFPIERVSCYSADLLLRQYSSLKGKLKKKQDFNYKKLKKVYTILIFEKSPAEFHKTPSTFLHRAKTKVDSGISLNFLQEFYFITLDIFKKSGYAKPKDKDDILSGWLHFLCTEKADDAAALCQTYPWLTDFYLEMAKYRQNPKEVLSMFSAALREMDRNTVKYMVVKQQETIDEQQETIGEQQETIGEQQETIDELNKEIEGLRAENAASLAKKDAEIARLREELKLSKKK